MPESERGSQVPSSGAANSDARTVWEVSDEGLA